MGRAITERMFQFLAITGGYVTLAWLSTKLGGTYNDVAGIWVPNAAAFALLWRNPGLRRAEIWVAIAAGSCLANMVKGSSFDVALLFTAYAVPYVWSLVRCTAWLTGDDDGRRSVPFHPVVISIVACSAGASLFAGTIGHLMFGWPLLESALRVAFANLLGAALILPFSLNVSVKRLNKIVKSDPLPEFVAWLAVCIATMVAAQAATPSAFAFSILPMMLAAMRLKHLQMAIICLVIGMVGITLATSGHVQNLGSGHWLATPDFQFAICVNILLPFAVCVLFGQVRSARTAFAMSEERLRRAVDEAPAGIVSVAQDGKLLECNPAFAAMLGYPRHEVEGRYIQDFTPPEDIPANQEIRRRASAGGFNTITFQTRYRRRDGSLFWVEISASCVRDVGKHQVVMVSQVNDIDARKRAERELVEMKDRWDFALASAGQGFWDHNVEVGAVNYSATWTSMLGYDPGEVDGNSDLWMEMIHPDDRDVVTRMDIDHKAGRLPYFESEYRLRHKEGHWVWVLDRGKVVERDDAGDVSRMIGTLTDISDRKSVEERFVETARMLSQEKERLRVTLESIGDAVICTDAENRISFMNPEAERLTGRVAADVAGRDLKHVYMARVDGEGKPDASGTDGRKAWQFSQLKRTDGAILTVREVTSPILSQDGAVDGQVIVFQDFTEMQRLQRELQHAVLHDDLTGILNRAGFLDALETLRIRAMRDGSEHQLLYIDLDRFKLVNDTAGHTAGDALLRLVASAIQQAVRSSDIVARLGGDEFAVVLPSCPEAYARLAAHSIVERVKALELDWNGMKLGVGASIGISTLDGLRSIDDVIAEADAGSYRAKAERKSALAQTPPARKSARLTR